MSGECNISEKALAFESYLICDVLVIVKDYSVFGPIRRTVATINGEWSPYHEEANGRLHPLLFGTFGSLSWYGAERSFKWHRRSCAS